MLQQMCWLPTLEPDGEKVLYLRTAPNQPWKLYTAYPDYAVPDSTVPGSSKGWTTYQKLRQSGWSLVSDTHAVEHFSLVAKATTF